MPVRSKGKGRYEADYQNKFRRIKRTRKTFKSRKEANEWLAAVHQQATDRLLGRRQRRLFGEALARYLREHSPQKVSHKDDIGNARALRWPYWDSDAGRLCRLEECPLEDVPAALGKWTLDQRGVRQRAYIHNQLYQLREHAGALVWFHQPQADTAAPPPRRQVRDVAVLNQLARLRGRGPFSNATLRVRQLLVHRVLFMAWKYWSVEGDVWLEQNIAEKIQLADKPEAREEWIENYDMLLSLLIAAPIGLDYAILAGVWIGWRRANLLLLEWDRVVFPIYEVGPDNQPEEVQPGYCWVPRRSVKKKKKPIVYPMVPHVEQLFRELWETRVNYDGHLYVFHDGTGKPFLTGKTLTKKWATAKRKAGFARSFCWHSLRHTWTSWMLQAGGHVKKIAELGGWSSTQMVEQVYGHLRTEHLRDTAKLSKRIN